MVSSTRFAGSAAEAAPAGALSQKLQGVEVFDLSGKAVPIVDLWKDRKAVIAFARHFGSVGISSANCSLSYERLPWLSFWHAGGYLQVCAVPEEGRSSRRETGMFSNSVYLYPIRREQSMLEGCRSVLCYLTRHSYKYENFPTFVQKEKYQLYSVLLKR